MSGLVIPQAPPACQRCDVLAECRHQIVNGRGKPFPTVCFVGQNPGQEEDKAGKAFVGKSGRLLALLCEAANLPLDHTYLTNAVRCLSPGNRKPKREEIENCREYLIEELRAIQPRCIITLGEVPFQSLCMMASSDGYDDEVQYWQDTCAEITREWQESVMLWQATVGHKAVDRPLKPRLPTKPKPEKAQHSAIRDVAGHTIIQADTGIPLIPSYHPAFLMRGKWEYTELVISHFEKARRLAESF